MRKVRVAKYRRVSKKEQAIKGFSLQAQDEALDEYIEKNNYIIAGEYADEGISASTLNRPALQRLLDDVRAGKIDLIIFTKLDRWFRSVAHYYKIQEILEKNNVAWRTVLEDYNTETSDGKFKVNIMLSVAQQELDRTSERIKTVFDSKIKNKQVITSSLPFGYMIGVDEQATKRVVKDKTKEQIVLDLFSHFEIHHSLRLTMRFINDKYDLNLLYNTCKNMVTNTMYMGEYRGVADYCPAYISKEQFNKIQTILKRKKIVRVNQNVYLFSGMFRCKECGSSASGCLSVSSNGQHYYYYRCGKYTRDASCTNSKRIAEARIEQYLLEHVEDELAQYIVDSEVKPEAIKPKYDKNKIQTEIDRLNNMYQKGRIDDTKYDEEYEKLQTKLELCALSTTKRDLRPLKSFLESDFQNIYKTLSREEQRATWRAIINKMIVRKYDDVDIDFI